MQPVRIDTAPTNEPMMTGDPGRTICVRAIPASVSASISAMQPAAVTGPIAPASTAGTTIVPWLCAAKFAQRTEHPAVEGKRGVGIDIAKHHRVLIDVTLAEQHFGHAHGIGRVTRCFRSRLAPLVAVAEEGVLHVQMSLARRYVHRLDGGCRRKNESPEPNVPA